MHTEIVRGLGIRDAPLFDQPHSLKLELARKLPSLHDPPPVPSKHLTRCLRNRVQANAFYSARKTALLSLIERVMGKQLLAASAREEQPEESEEEEEELIVAA